MGSCPTTPPANSNTSRTTTTTATGVVKGEGLIREILTTGVVEGEDLVWEILGVVEGEGLIREILMAGRGRRGRGSNLGGAHGRSGQHIQSYITGPGDSSGTESGGDRIKDLLSNLPEQKRSFEIPARYILIISIRIRLTRGRSPQQ